MKINQKCINTARILSAEMINRANSGHTGVALGAAPILYALFKDHYNFYSSKYINRDRFVLSAGHASALYYSCLHLFGFDVSMEDLKNFRKLGSKTPGHPEYNVTDGVETSTGPLGQGVANAVGLALAQKTLAERFNVQKFNIIDNYTYCFVGDGCLMEGVAQEACSFAGNLKLNKLILLYDCNQITIDGKLNVANTESVKGKFKAMGWNVITVSNGNSYLCITKAISRAKKSKNKPTIIIFKTQIGYGSVYAGSNEIHGKALTDEELAKLRQNLGVEGGFKVDEDVKEYCYRAHRRAKVEYFKWEKQVVLYKNTHPDLCQQFFDYFNRPKLNLQKLCKGKFTENMAMRDANHVVINQVAKNLVSFMGGTADVAPSTKVYIDDGGDFSSSNYRGRNIHYGVREHAMAAISNGISLYANSSVFCSTFLSFSNYALPAIRMSALMNLPVMYIFTHDSIIVGEDGPTHQPVEQLTQLRAIPNLTVYRPADTNELMAVYSLAYENKKPSAFIIAKQALPEIHSSFEGATCGAYVLAEDEKPEVIMFASGSEVGLAMKAKETLNKDGISAVIVSVPSIEVFERQPEKFKKSILKHEIKNRFCIEASNDYKWLNVFGGKLFGVTSFGASGKGKDVLKFMNYEPKDLVKFIKNSLKNE